MKDEGYFFYPIDQDVAAAENLSPIAVHSPRISGLISLGIGSVKEQMSIEISMVLQISCVDIRPNKRTSFGP
jgi:hypothetical protein